MKRGHTGILTATDESYSSPNMSMKIENHVFAQSSCQLNQLHDTHTHTHTQNSIGFAGFN
jgi:hypothetical protein